MFQHVRIQNFQDKKNGHANLCDYVLIVHV